MAQARGNLPRGRRVEMKLAVGLWPLLLAAPCTAVVLEKPAQHKRLLPKGLLRPYIGGWEQQGCPFGFPAGDKNELCRFGVPTIV